MASIITPSTDFDNNLSGNVQTLTTIVGSLTDGTATFSGGTIVNLVTPTAPQDAVTKGFISGTANPAAPVNSVQYNEMIFGGSANLTFVPNTLTVDGIIDVSGITITGGSIAGLTDPTTGNEIATKNYVDSFSSTLANNYIKSDIAVTYTPQQMINSIVLRNLSTSNVDGVTLTDTTASASAILGLLSGATIGTTVRWKLMNDDPSANESTDEARNGFVLSVSPGAGITFSPATAFNLRRGYLLDAYIVFTNVITPAATIIINRCYFQGVDTYSAPVTGTSILSSTLAYLNVIPMSLTNCLLFPLTAGIIATTNYTYSTTDINNRLIQRNPSGAASDTLGPINPLYLNQIIVVQNLSAFTITISGQTNIWSLSPSPIIIQPSHQNTIAIHSVIPNISSPGSGYNLGNYNTTGGTGTGMTVIVESIITTTAINIEGDGYATGDYTTTNLTTPSATGLYISVFQVDGSGAIQSIFPVVDYLTNYQNGDILQVNGGNNAAMIRLNLVNTVSTYNITSLGNGYVSGDVVTFSGPGTGSGAQITLSPFIHTLSLGTSLF